MKYLNKLLCAAVLFASTAFSANAVLITQSINVTEPGSEFTLGYVTIEIANSDLGNGLVSTFDFVELNIFGGTVFDVFDFEAVVDGDNIGAGIEFLAFDVTELSYADNWAYQLIIDNYAPDWNFLDIFTPDNDPVFFTSYLALGRPQVVSEPSMLVLLSMGMLALGMRRRAAK